LVGAVKSIDIFGESIGFEIGGGRTHKTLLGAAVSLAIIVLTASYTLTQFNTMKDYLGTRHISFVEPDVNNRKVVAQAESGLNLAIGLYSNLGWNPEPVDWHGYLEFSFRLRSWGKEAATENKLTFFQKIDEIPTHKCTQGDVDKFYEPAEYLAGIITATFPYMLCVDNVSDL